MEMKNKRDKFQACCERENSNGQKHDELGRPVAEEEAAGDIALSAEGRLFDKAYAG
jgi:hypothetical protein